MKTVKGKTKILYEIKNSKFYALLYQVDSKKKVDQILQELKLEYKDATHYCYAYVIDGEEKCNDDGEPSGTAGMPMLNVLKQKNLNHILCVVIRYFGGIKLGAGGLVRAYSKATSLVFEKSIIIDIEFGWKIRIEFPYENVKPINHLLKDYLICYKEYGENIIYELSIKESNLELVVQELKPYLLKIERLEQILC